ncbi:MAG: hypothetical protein GY751_00405 [Bacteroidetes bacterium]|nr:hypothetical protein [Bacteroidota bacterium]
MKKLFIFLNLFALCAVTAWSQGYISGDLELRNDYYIEDDAIGATGTDHYTNLKSSLDSWISTNYRNNDIDFEVGVRIDFFLNSRLHDPSSNAFTKVGLGSFYVKKKVSKLTITGGHFYDQFGSGIVFRSYEDRSLGIDNSILGVHLQYDINDNWALKAFGGLRHNRESDNFLSTDLAFIKGINAEGYIPIGEKVSILPGASVVNRTIDEESMKQIASNINNYPNFADRFVPKYNVFLFSAYTTVNVGDFSWYVEGAYKTKEAVKVAEGQPYANTDGNAVYTTLSWSKKGIGITAQFKRTDHFQFRNAPDDEETILNGGLNFLPPVNKQNSLRLPARYAPASQEIEEQALSLDVTAKLAKNATLNFNYSEIHDFGIRMNGWKNSTLFREFYVDVEWKAGKKISGLTGMNYADYNQLFYEGEFFGDPDYPHVMAISPFVEFTYKIKRKHSLRTEWQYQNSKDDFGQWIYALIEYSFAPMLSISVSDMWNFSPGPNPLSANRHYYSAYVSYTHKQNRFYVSYVRQVAGVVCTGGVCRNEPAFNGVRAGVTASF